MIYSLVSIESQYIFLNDTSLANHSTVVGFLSITEMKFTRLECQKTSPITKNFQHGCASRIDHSIFARTSNTSLLGIYAMLTSLYSWDQ